MELKQEQLATRLAMGVLLIVPYGIETPVLSLLVRSACLLLIVPYGIETT